MTGIQIICQNNFYWYTKCFSQECLKLWKYKKEIEVENKYLVCLSLTCAVSNFISCPTTEVLDKMVNRNCVYERRVYFPYANLQLFSAFLPSQKMVLETTYSTLGTSTEHNLFKEKSAKYGFIGKSPQSCQKFSALDFKKNKCKETKEVHFQTTKCLGDIPFNETWGRPMALWTWDYQGNRLKKQSGQPFVTGFDESNSDDTSNAGSPRS